MLKWNWTMLQEYETNVWVMMMWEGCVESRGHAPSDKCDMGVVCWDVRPRPHQSLAGFCCLLFWITHSAKWIPVMSCTRNSDVTISRALMPLYRRTCCLGYPQIDTLKREEYISKQTEMNKNVNYVGLTVFKISVSANENLTGLNSSLWWSGHEGVWQDLWPAVEENELW